MFRVHNKKAIKRLAGKCFQESKTRNRIAVLAILLTAVLFTTVFTMAIGMKDTFEYNAKKMVGGDGMAVLKYVTDEQYEQIRNHPLIEEISYNKIVADSVDNSEFLKRHVELYFMDETAIKLSFIELDEGRFPEAENEICMDSKSLALLGVPLQLGETVRLEINVKGTVQTREFVLSGYWSSYEMLNVGFGLVSEQYVDAYQEELANTYWETWFGSGAINSYIMFKNSFDIQNKLDRVIEESGFTKEEDAPNYIASNVSWAYISSGKEDNSLTVLAFGGGVFLILLAGYLIIYNIFQISVIQDIRFYGLLKTIGTTGRQIKSIIRNQALRLSLYGIPLGLVAGFLLGKLLLPLMMAGSAYPKDEIRITLNPLIFMGAAALTLFTVFVSCRKPGKIAASVSCVEAVKYVEDGQRGKKRKKSTDGGRLHRMAFSNLGRNKKRTVLALLSLSLSIVLLNSTVSFVESFDIDKFLSKFVDTDFLLGDAEYFNNNFSNERQAVSESFIKQATQRPEFQEGGRIFCNPSSYVKHYFKEKRKELYTYGSDSFDMYVNDNGDFYNSDLEGNPLCVLYGMQELPLARLNILEGEQDIEALKQLLDTGDYIIVGVMMTDDGKINESENRWKIGDKVTFLLPEGGEKECEIIAKAQMNTYTNTVRKWTSEISCYTTETGFEKLSDTKWTMSYALEAHDGMEKEMEDFLAAYTTKEEPQMGFESKSRWLDEYYNFQRMFGLIGYGMAVIIGIIGVLNFVNTILTSIVTRNREFAMLKAIGMTGKQLVTMVCLEGLYYAGGTVLLSGLFSLVVSATLIKSFAGIMWFTSYHFTILPVLFVSPFLVVLGTLIPAITEKLTQKRSIVEQLGRNE